MSRPLSNDDIFVLADALSLELTRDRARSRNQLSGQRIVDLKIMEGQSFPMNLRVVDSGVYAAEGKAGVLVQICGSLYALLLVSTKSFNTCEYLQVWLLDGAKIAKSTKGDANHSVFPRAGYWSREVLYKHIAEAVVCGYRRSGKHGAKWVLVEEARKELTDYVASEKGVVSAGGTAITLAQQICEKYRTLGPRGV